MNKDDIFVKQHIELIQRLLYENDGIELPGTVIEALNNKYMNNDQMTLIDKIKGINKDVEDYLASIVQSNEMLPDLDSIKKDKEEKKIDLNHHDVNLMLIAKATTPEELQDAINKVPNLNVNLTKSEMSDDDFNFIKSSVFDMYKESIPKDERYSKDFNMTIDEYKDLDTNIHDNYDKIHMDDGSLKGKTYDAKKNVDLEEIKNDKMSNKEEEIKLQDGFRDEKNSKTLLVEDFEGTSKEKQKFDVKKEDFNNRKEEMDAMFPSNKEEQVKEKDVNTKNDNQPKRLKLNTQDSKKESGFAQTQSMYLLVLVMLFALFTLLLKFLV